MIMGIRITPRAALGHDRTQVGPTVLYLTYNMAVAGYLVLLVLS